MQQYSTLRNAMSHEAQELAKGKADTMLKGIIDMYISIAKVEYQGKRYKLMESGYIEHDTNAWVETGDCVVIDEETGEEADSAVLERVVEVRVNPLYKSEVTVFDKLCGMAQWKLEIDDGE